MESKGLNDSRIDGWWDVARTGHWRGSLGGSPAEVEITAEDLEQIAADYDPELQEAPVTVEHMRSGPAHGWVERLRVAGDRLQARFRNLSAQLREWLTSGAYRSRSVEMYKPFAATGRTYLGAVSFLGAAPPAVKGLSPEPSELAEPVEGTARVECVEMRVDTSPEEQGLAGWLAGSLRGMFREETGTEERLVRLEEETSRLSAALVEERAIRESAEAERESLAAQLTERDSRAERTGFEAALESASRQGCLTPAERELYRSLGARLDSEGRGALLAEVAGRSPLALFRELAAPEEKARSAEETLARRRAQFEAFPEDPEHDAALEAMAREPELAFAEALARVRRERAAV